jgi:hypothetical protein
MAQQTTEYPYEPTPISTERKVTLSFHWWTSFSHSDYFLLHCSSFSTRTMTMTLNIDSMVSGSNFIYLE